MKMISGNGWDLPSAEITQAKTRNISTETTLSTKESYGLVGGIKIEEEEMLER
jgi:hypothetical protein